MKLKRLLPFLLLGLTFNTFAGETKSLKVEEKISINAPAEKVWGKLKNFGDMGAWHPAIAKTEIVYGKNNVSGATRLLTLQDGGKIKELLFNYSDSKMSYKYGMINTVLPVSRYVSTIAITPDGANKCVVLWKGKFKRADSSDTPAKGEDDETATKSITDIYRNGLANLKKISEK